MKIIKQIKVTSDKYNELRKLDCVERIEWWHDGTFIVFLKPEYTNGKREVIANEYLCQFENGLWQRFGGEAINRAFRNPGKEAGTQWQDE